MKALFINGSPRKNFNTAQMLPKANLFSEKQRKERHEAQFPVDLQNVYDLGVRLRQQSRQAS